MSDTMRVAIGLPGNATDDHLRYARQLGCEGVVLATPARLSGGQRWEEADLVGLREWVESHGLRLEALQNLPHDFWMKVRLGEPGRDEQLEHFQATLRNMGRAGIPVLGYNFRPDPLYRTANIPGRGGAIVTAFDRAQAENRPLTFGREISAEEVLANHAYFLKAVLPAAEEAGVRLALHPDDPPGPALGGVARVFSSFEGFVKAAEQAGDSPAWGILLCTGCWSEMGGMETVMRGIRHFGPRGQIVYVHFRDVQGTGDRFAECFIGEGNLDVTAVMLALKEVGFTGWMIDDHVPHMWGDEGWAPRGRAYATGYLMGLLRAVNDLARTA
jgi:mannonate dehydratase